MLVLLAAVILSATPALADINMYYTGPNGNIMNNVYTDPYNVIVGGGLLGKGGVPMHLLCDDAEANISPNLQFKANPIALADAGTQGKFAYQLDAQTKYNEVGWLAAQLMAGGWTGTAAKVERAGLISYAIWDIFTPGVEGYLAGLTPEQRAGVAQWELDASLHSATALSYVTVYVPDPLNSSQEFVGVPDGGVTVMLLGGVLVGLGTLRRRFRV